MRTAPGNVNMVAYGKINTRLSPAVALAVVDMLSKLAANLNLVKEGRNVQTK